MSTPETRESVGKHLRPSSELGDLLRKADEWIEKHPVAAKRAVDLAHILPTQSDERQRRISGLIKRLYSRK